MPISVGSNSAWSNSEFHNSQGYMGWAGGGVPVSKTKEKDPSSPSFLSLFQVSFEAAHLLSAITSFFLLLSNGYPIVFQIYELQSTDVQCSVFPLGRAVSLQTLGFQ